MAPPTASQTLDYLVWMVEEGRALDSLNRTMGRLIPKLRSQGLADDIIYLIVLELLEAEVKDR